eukprot:4258767-Amphidinium_carterae.1
MKLIWLLVLRYHPLVTASRTQGNADGVLGESVLFGVCEVETQTLVAEAAGTLRHPHCRYQASISLWVQRCGPQEDSVKHYDTRKATSQSVVSLPVLEDYMFAATPSPPRA